MSLKDYDGWSHDYDISFYDQGRHINALSFDVLPAADPRRGGVCFALSCLWVQRHKTHKAEGAEGRIAHIKKSDSLTAAINAQGKYIETPMTTQAEKEAAKNSVSSDFGFSLGDPIERVNVNMAAGIKQLEKLLTSCDHTHLYTHISFGYAEGGRHTTASYKSGGKIFGFGAHLAYFDPNLGEAKVPSRHIQDFFGDLMDAYAAQWGLHVSDFVVRRVDG